MSIEGAGDLTIQSGGKTTMQGTKIDVKGKENIDRAGGLEVSDLPKDKNKTGGIGLSKPKNPLTKPSVQTEGNTGN